MTPDANAIRPVGSSLPGTGIHPAGGGKTQIRPGSKPGQARQEKEKESEPQQEDGHLVDRYA